MGAAQGSVVLRGYVISGLGKSRLFTGIPWVRDQFVSRLGIDPWLGTLNLRIVEEDLPKLERLKKQTGIELLPQEPGFCSAKSFRATINGKVSGAVLFPGVENYPTWQMEIVSQKQLRQELALKEGDEVRVEVILD
ncbi:MAG: CTP-dependent riboflavin kinase [Dehalococcoidia bacterium]|nr:CTP-dependent riboflavin kinase [Dehalococcoidia bacterium]